MTSTQNNTIQEKAEQVLSVQIVELKSPVVNPDRKAQILFTTAMEAAIEENLEKTEMGEFLTNLVKDGFARNSEEAKTIATTLADVWRQYWRTDFEALFQSMTRRLEKRSNKSKINENKKKGTKMSTTQNNIEPAIRFLSKRIAEYIRAEKSTLAADFIRATNGDSSNVHVFDVLAEEVTEDDFCLRLKEILSEIGEI